MGLSKTVLHILTILVWIILVLSVLWTGVSLVWFLLSKVWFPDLYTPISIRFTVTLFIFLLFWGLAVGILFFFWHRHNKKQQVCLPALSEDVYLPPPTIPWAEITYFGPQNQNSHIHRRSFSPDLFIQSSPSKMMSFGIHLYHLGYTKEAISIFRLVLDNPDASLLLREVAHYRLIQILARTRKLYAKE